MAKVFVIDDEAGLRRVIARALQDAGHAVSVHEHGRHAIDRIEQERPDLLITDIFMPEMEGLETIRRARQLRPQMPVIAMSGYSDEQGDYLAIAEKFGADATLRKPFSLAELVQLVARLLSQS